MRSKSPGTLENRSIGHLHLLALIESQVSGKTLKYEQTVPGSSVDVAGTHGPSGTSGDTENPRDRGQFNVTWNQGGLEISGTVNYAGGMSVTDPTNGNDLTCAGALASETSAIFNAPAFPAGSTVPSQYCHIKSFTDFDLYARYNFAKNWEVHASVNNLFAQHHLLTCKPKVARSTIHHSHNRAQSGVTSL